MAGAPAGNNNAGKGKPWRDAIDRALAKRTKSRYEGKLALDELAEQLLVKCEDGDMTALKELGDRQDGKSSQSIDHTTGGQTINVILPTYLDGNKDT